MFVLKRATTACRQQMTTVNLLQKHFKQLIILYLDTNAISNQINLKNKYRKCSGDAIWFLQVYLADLL